MPVTTMLKKLWCSSMWCDNAGKETKGNRALSVNLQDT